MPFLIVVITNRLLILNKPIDLVFIVSSKFRIQYIFYSLTQIFNEHYVENILFKNIISKECIQTALKKKNVFKMKIYVII